MKLLTDNFTGIIPATKPHKLPQGAAQVAHNVDLSGGTLSPMRAPVVVDGVTLGAGTKSIYPYNDGWLSWPYHTSICRNPAKDDSFERLCYTKPDDYPRVKAIVDGAVIDQRLGMDVPASSLDVSVSAGVPSLSGVTMSGSVRTYTPGGGEAFRIIPGMGSNVNDYKSGKITYITDSYYDHDEEFPYRMDFNNRLNFLLCLIKTYSSEDGYKYEYSGGVAGDNIPLSNGTYNLINIDVFDNGEPAGSISLAFAIAEGDYMQYVSKDNPVVFGHVAIEASAHVVIGNYIYDSIEFSVPNFPAHFHRTLQWLDVFGGNRAPINFALKQSELNKESRYYTYTLIDQFSEESANAPISSRVEVYPYDTVTLSGWRGNIDSAAEKVRLYRSMTTENSKEFSIVTEIDVSASAYVDNVEDADLYGTLESSGYDPAPAGLCGIVSLPGGFLAGFKENELYFSEVYRPHAWPTDYQLTVDYNITALAVIDGMLLVLTEGKSSLCTGSSPDSMLLTQLTIDQACVSARGISMIGGTVCYPSPDGYVIVAGSTAELLTAEIFTRDQWQAYHPETMIAETHDSKLYLFSDVATLLFDFSKGLKSVSTISAPADAVYSDLLTDTLYIAVGQTLQETGKGTALQMQWKSGEIRFPRPVRFYWVRVDADEYPVNILISREGMEDLEINVDSDKPQRLPFTQKSKTFTYTVIANTEVRFVNFGTSFPEVQS